MRRLIVLLAALVSAPAIGEVNLCWSQGDTWQRCEAGRSVWSRATTGGYSDYAGGSWRDFAVVPSNEAVYICEANRPIGAGEGCPVPGNYAQERFVLKSSLVPSPPVPPPPPTWAEGEAILSWVAPTVRTDGSAITGALTYRIETSAGVAIVTVPASPLTITGLSAGEHCWRVVAIEGSNASAPSNPACKTITEPTVPPVPVDCVVSSWGPWVPGAWSACAAGSQSRDETRIRTVLTPSANGGAACPALTETRTVTQACVAPAVVVPNVGGLQHAVVFGITATGGRSSTVLGFVPVGTACEGAIVYRYRAQDYRRIPQAAVIWWASTPTTNAAAACR